MSILFDCLVIFFFKWSYCKKAWLHPSGSFEQEKRSIIPVSFYPEQLKAFNQSGKRIIFINSPFIFAFDDHPPTIMITCSLTPALANTWLFLCRNNQLAWYCYHAISGRHKWQNNQNKQQYKNVDKYW
jgi:hypothetical protein